MSADWFQDVGGTLVARYPAVPGAKRDGTSLAAAKAMRPTASTLRDYVLAALRERPSTADELAGILGKTPFAIRPRVTELSRLGKICETSERRRNTSGKLAAVYRAI